MSFISCYFLHIEVQCSQIDIKMQRPHNWIYDLNLIHSNLLSTTEF